MISPISTQDILDRTNDLLSNYTTGSIDLGNRMRAVNSAIEYVKRLLTLPSDEQIQRFYYTEDTMFYNLEDDFNEGLYLIYDNPIYNTPERRWTFAPYQDLLATSGNRWQRSNRFGWTSINGQMQLVLSGRNINQGTQLATFDDLNDGFVPLGDASNFEIDNNIYQEGNGSLSFTITKNTGIASISWPTNYDFTTLLQNGGYIKFYTWLASINIASIDIRLITDVGDYYASSVTEFDDSTPFSAGLGVWKRLGFQISDATPVGSPAINNITSMQIDFVLGPSFGASPIPDFRVDNLFSIVPDYMDLTYLSSIKGTDTTGENSKIFLTDASDIPAFGNFVPDLLDLIAYRAAIILVPQTINNAQFKEDYKAELKDIMNSYGKTFPRRRVNNFGKLILSRPRR